MSEEQKIIDLENEITFLKDVLSEQQKEIEERDKYNITTLPFEEIKEDIEQNKSISIFGKEYISKDKIREWLDRFELEEELQDKYDEFLGSQAIYKFLKKLLEET